MGAISPCGASDHPLLTPRAPPALLHPCAVRDAPPARPAAAPVAAGCRAALHLTFALHLAAVIGASGGRDVIFAHDCSVRRLGVAARCAGGR